MELVREAGEACNMGRAGMATEETEGKAGLGIKDVDGTRMRTGCK